MPPSSWRCELLALVPDSSREVKGEEVKKRGPRGIASVTHSLKEDFLYLLQEEEEIGEGRKRQERESCFPLPLKTPLADL